MQHGGTPVVILQPTAADLEVILLNLKDGAAHVPVARRALQTTLAALEAHREWREPLRILEAAAAAG